MTYVNIDVIIITISNGKEIHLIMETVFYDGTRLLSLKDINGSRPEIYICTSNRSAGKTTFFARWAVNRFIKYGEKFMLLYRYNYELDDVADKFFKDISTLFFPKYSMTSARGAQGLYHTLYLSKYNGEKEDKPARRKKANADDECCGYAVTLNSADQVKKYSHLFSDTQRILFDEFQSESNKYCDREVSKFLSIHTSVARGNGKQVRFLPVYMISNPVSIINPYYTALKVSARLRDDTRFLKGDGFVLEQGFVHSASEAQKNSAFNRAFAGSEYTAYASEAVYLNDNMSFVEKMKGRARYLATYRYEGANYAIREYADEGLLYVDDNADISFPGRFAVTTEDHRVNYVMLKRNDMFVSMMRFYFEKGCFRFKDLKCKESLMKMISY